MHLSVEATRLLLALAVSCLLGCGFTGPAPSRPCDADSPCQPGFECIPNYERETVCMRVCPAGRTTTCLDGTFCYDVFDGRRVCWPGGPTPRGSDCTTLLECSRGAFCVGLVGAASGTCVVACEPPSGEGTIDTCPPSTACMLTTMGEGFCGSF